MDPADLDSYFRRIGWTGPRTASREVLAGLCLRHTASIPFGNVDILLGESVKLDVPSLVDKLVTRRRPGYCFEQNGLFHAVLSELGFRVTSLSARVRLGVAPDVHTPRTHMLLRVELDDGPHVVDVGFGFTPTAPLRLEAAREQSLHLSTYRFTRAADAAPWTLEIRQPEGFVPAYVFTEEPALPVDYEMANHFTSTHPRSHFTLAPLVMRHDPEGGVRRVLWGRELTTRRGKDGLQSETRRLSGPEEVTRALREELGVDVAEGTSLRGTE